MSGSSASWKGRGEGGPRDSRKVCDQGQPRARGKRARVSAALRFEERRLGALPVPTRGGGQALPQPPPPRPCAAGRSKREAHLPAGSFPFPLNPSLSRFLSLLRYSLTVFPDSSGSFVPIQPEIKRAKHLLGFCHYFIPGWAGGRGRGWKVALVARFLPAVQGSPLPRPLSQPPPEVASAVLKEGEDAQGRPGARTEKSGWRPRNRFFCASPIKAGASLATLRPPS